VQTQPRRRTCGIPLHHLLRCSNTATAAPQNQANCNAQKFAVVGCDVLQGVGRLRQLHSLRKINCTLQNAVAEKAAWWAARCYAGLVAKSLLKVRLRCKAGHAAERAAFRSTICSTHSAVPLRKINCSLQNALVEKAAWCVAM